MKKFITLLAIALSTTTLAEGGIKWDAVEVSKTTVEDFAGYGYGATATLGDQFFITAEIAKLGNDFRFYGVDIAAEVVVGAVGLGVRAPLSPSSDFFAVYSKYKVRSSLRFTGYSNSADESGDGFALGVRSMLTDKIEVIAFADYTDVSFASTSAHVGLQYHVNKRLSVGVDYEKDGGVAVTSLIARAYF